jgi:hypothetical protein
MPGLGEGASRVGLAVGPFVAMVIREPIGQDNQQTSSGSSLPLQGRGTVTDGCSEPSKASWAQASQTTLRQRRHGVVKSLHRVDVHSGAPLRAKSVEGDAVADLVERCGEISRSGHLVVVNDAAGPARLACRTRDVQENEHREVPPTPLALDINVFVRKRVCPDLDVEVDYGVEIKIHSLRLATLSLDLRPEAG